MSPLMRQPDLCQKLDPGKWHTLLMWLVCAAAWLPAQAQIPTINPDGLVNAATGRSASSIPVTARGTIVSIYGHNFSTGPITANGFPLPKELGGVQVLFGSLPAALLYVSPSQINAQVPFEIPDVSSVDLVVRSDSGNSVGLKVTLLAQDPGIFSIRVSPATPVSAGESFTIWANGLGAVLPAVPSGEPGPENPPAIAAITPVVKLGGRHVVVDFAGLAPGQVIYQINATAPADLAAPTSEVTVEPGLIPAVTGPPGPIGPTGATGAAGSPGPAGAVGARGTNGAAGANGPMGPGGATGPTGTSGPQGLSWRGTWSSTKAYAVNNAVQFNGTSYIAIQAATRQQPDTSPTFWSVLAQQGSVGARGTNGAAGMPGAPGANGMNGSLGTPGAPGLMGPQGLTWRGTWSNTTGYALNDAVQFNGTSYIGIQAATGHQPDTSPAFWSVLAQQGSTGAVGTSGANGINGSPGTQGVPGIPGSTGPQGLTWRGTWSNTTAYALNDAVQFNGTSYTSIQAGTGNEPDTSQAFWSVLAQQGSAGAVGTSGTNGINGSPGIQGVPGTAGTNGTNGSLGTQGLPGIPGSTGPQGLTWRGTWSNTTGYALNDAVQFNGTSYISIQAGTGNEPDTSPAFWSVLAQQGSAGTAGTSGTNGINGSPGIQGVPGIPGSTGPQGLTWRGTWSNTTGYVPNDVVPFNGTSYISIQAGTGREPDTSPTFWSVLALMGAPGANSSGGSIAFSDFYALMPGDNAATVAPATDVSFPQNGPTSGGAIARTGASRFSLSAIGTYQVMFQVSVDEPGQLILTLNGNELAYTAVGRATGTSQLVGMSLVNTFAINSTLTVRNPAGNSTALTITPLAGGTIPVSAHLVITQIQ